MDALDDAVSFEQLPPFGARQSDHGAIVARRSENSTARLGQLGNKRADEGVFSVRSNRA